MKQVTQSLLLLVLLSVIGAAQAPVPAAKFPHTGEGNNNQIYGGFLFMPTDWGPAWQKYYGFDINYTRTIHRRFGAVLDYDFTRNNASLVGDLDRGQPHNSRQWAFRAGPRVNLLSGGHHRFEPYLVGLFGAAHFTALVPYPGRQSPLVQKDWFGFTWAVGGGMDVRVTKHFGVRGQWDTARVPWGTETTDASQWDRITGGATFRW
jgi:opacity protein-like surface antigen